MDSTLVTAAAAAMGSLAGAAASIATTWLTHRTQTIRADHEWRLREGERLFDQFIMEASRLALDALTHSMERPDQIMALYGLLSRIRLVSGEEVVRHGVQCCRRIVELYGRPNLTIDEVRAAVVANRVNELDPLKDFSNACRNELLAGQG